jgi:hypothetical protein
MLATRRTVASMNRAGGNAPAVLDADFSNVHRHTRNEGTAARRERTLFALFVELAATDEATHECRDRVH